jgi:7-cyano-7-deazaguanine synthase in queuosine biosynthesis
MKEEAVRELVRAAKEAGDDIKRGWLCRDDNKCGRCSACKVEAALRRVEDTQ